MMIAFSVASETRNLKHAYAMGARVVVHHSFIGIRRRLLLLLLLLLLVTTSAGRTEADEEDSLETEIEIVAATSETTTTTTTTSTERSNTNRLINVESLQGYCKFERTTLDNIGRCKGFNFDCSEETAFFDLPTKVEIAPDGATYELGDEQHLNSLIMENSTFVNFPLHLFYEIPQLSDLDLRSCGIRHVSWECFLAADNLTILLLSDNEITELGESIFNYASKLEYMFMSNNKLSSLHPDAFKGLQKLRHLDLSGNQLKLLPERIFEDLAGLQDLILADNQLRIISNDLLIHNFRLQTVILRSNHLRHLAEYAFRSADHLMLVDVSHNTELDLLLLSLNVGQLWAKNCSLNRVNLFGAVSNVDLDNNHLQELYFSTSEALQHLVLRNNSLLQLATLSKVPRLRHLNVADNPQLGDLPKDWKTPQLELLDLSNTGLLQLPVEALRGMPELRKLNISANMIREIDPHAFEYLKQLTHFYIHANDWNCFNLKLVMDLLILQYGISYTSDKYDADFPGSYIKGIACMYRMEEKEQISSEVADSASSASASVEYSQLVEPSEVQKLRNELKTVVQHFEARLDVVNEQLQSLNGKMQFLEHMNRTLWNQVSIKV